MSLAIAVENLSKKYIIKHQNREGYTALRDVLANGAKRFTHKLIHPFAAAENDPTHEEFWALKDINFEVKQGDRVGIIGRNGAGKSTLLKILSRITEPTSGKITIKGRVASLLEVGTGFHPELTGRENLFLNGAILGLSNIEIKKKFDEIVAFAEVEKFLDTPVKQYSSGMRVRLSFAVAAHLEPEILIVDEVLAVGDAQFQKKCMGKMENVGKEGRTILFVSHNMAAVNALCSKAMVLNQGSVAYNGSVIDAANFYLQSSNLSMNAIKWEDNKQAPGNENIRLKSISVKPKEGTVLNIDSGVLIEIHFYNTVINANLGTTMHLWTIDGICVFESGILFTQNKESKEGFYTVTVEIPPHLLNAGTYKITQKFGRDQRYLLFKIDDVISFELSNTSTGRGTNMERAPGVIRPILNWSAEYGEVRV